MCADEAGPPNFEQILRAMAQQFGDSIERTLDQVDIDEVATRFGVDPEQARDWVDGATAWMRWRVDNLGDEMGGRMPGWPASSAPGTTPAKGADSTGDDPLRSAGPHPLDLPTEDQGLALAALDSGRWTVEPGTNALSAHGEGPGPSDALGLVRELRARDWIATDGEVTLVGRHALSRWLDAAMR
jgi:hypothetical protein